MKTVLIIAETKADFEECIATYGRRDQQIRNFRHVTTKDDLFGYEAPIEVRFWGRWHNLLEAGWLEAIAKELQKKRTDDNRQPVI